MQANSIQHFDPRALLAAAAGVVLAVVLGVLVGSMNISVLSIFAVLGLSLLYVLFLYRFTLQAAFFLSFAGFTWIGAGFQMTASIMVVSLGFGLIAITAWRKAHSDRPAELMGWSFDLLQVALLLWLAYVFVHLSYNYQEPFIRTEFAFSNFIKSYFPAVAPILLLLYFLRNPFPIRIRPSYLSGLVYCYLIALGCSILIRLYQFAVGAYIPVSGLEDETGGVFVIPVIGLVEGMFALRNLAPIGALLCTVLLTSNADHKVSRFLLWVTLFATLFGAVISGGRAAVLFALFCMMLVMLFRKRFATIFALSGVAVVAVALLNLFPGYFKDNAPLLAQRSVQWLLFTETGAEASIQSSTDWRGQLFSRAIQEWRSHPRIFWFGRATYAHGSSDLVAQAVDRSQGRMETALRRGNTHNLITDLLVMYGLVGLLLFTFVVVAALLFYHHLYATIKEAVAKDLALICLLCAAFFFSYSFIAGGSLYREDLIWLTILLSAVLYQRQHRVSATPDAVEESADHFPTKFPVQNIHR